MWVLGMVIMVDQIDQNVVRGVISQIQADFHVNDAQIGVLLSAFVLVNGLVTVPAGYLADRWNRTRTIGHTVLGWSFITMLTAAASEQSARDTRPVVTASVFIDLGSATKFAPGHDRDVPIEPPLMQVFH